MYEKIVLHNIECHPDTTINLISGSNGIVGQTGSGKSVIERAFKSLFFFSTMNTRYEEEVSSIELYYDGGKLFGRYREDEIKYKCVNCNKISSKSVVKTKCCNTAQKEHRVKISDTYIIEGKTYEVMGKGYDNLIEEIRDDMPLALMTFGGKPFPIGIKAQDDPFIWKQLSNKELSRVFSVLEGNDYVHDMLQLVKKELKIEADTLKRIEPELPQDLQELQECEVIASDKTVELQKATQKHDRCVKLVDSINSVNSMNEDIEKIIVKGRVYRSKIEDLKVKPWRTLQEDLDKFVFLNDTLNKFLPMNSSIEALEVKISKLKLDGYKKLESCLEKYTNFTDMVLDSEKLKLKVRETIARKVAVSEELEATKDLWKEVIIEKNICPYSGWELCKKCKDKFIEEYGE